MDLESTTPTRTSKHFSNDDVCPNNIQISLTNKTTQFRDMTYELVFLCLVENMLHFVVIISLCDLSL